MDDLTKKQEELTAEVWKQIERLERRLNSLRDALQQAGPGAAATMVAQAVADEATGLLLAAAKADAFGDAARLM